MCRVLLNFGLLLTLVSCVSTTTPQDTLRAYARAVESGDSDVAWALISPGARASASRERFDAEFDQRVQAGPAFIESLDEAAKGSAALYATLPYSEYESLVAEFVDGAWVIASGVAAGPPQSTPRDTLRAFLRAFEARDGAALWRLVPREFRVELEPADLERWMIDREGELVEIVALLRASVEAPIRTRGDQATLRYGSHEMRFALERERWVIVDFD